jgi:hypothetical protein
MPFLERAPYGIGSGWSTPDEAMDDGARHVTRVKNTHESSPQLKD